jgi:hypothetical protein
MRPRSFAATASLCAILVPAVSGVPATARNRVAPPPQAAQPATSASEVPVRSTRLERRDVTRGLAATADQIRRAETGPLWLAWRVPAVAGHHDGHKSDWSGDGRCVLDDDGDIGPHGTSITEQTGELIVLVRSEKGRYTRVTFTDARCSVDAGTRPVYWLSPVAPAESVALLAAVVREDAVTDKSDAEDHDKGSHRQALPALALHADGAADGVLASFVEPSQPRWLRNDAAFWLGAARGAAGAPIIDRLARHDRDDRFREHLTFVLTLNGDAGLDTLIDLARHDASAQVRSQALFWLGQKAGQRATGVLTRALDDDPDSDVRQKAVFALSQLPREQGIPKLIEVARGHRDPNVRRQAMFWLGQSGDPRAVQFFEDVLKK